MVTAYATRSPSYYTVEPMREFFQGLLFWAFSVGVVVFPTCLIVVTPLLKLLPPSSPLRRPGIAAFIGAASGPIAMYVWAAVFLKSSFVPDIREDAHLYFGCGSALVGATFAFTYALLYRNSRNG